MEPKLPEPTYVGEGIDLPKATRKRLKTIAENRAVEMCGFILKDGTIIEILNVAANRHCTFEMAPSQQLDAMKEHGDDIIAVYHTHPSGALYPSKHDIDGWPYGLKHRYLIVSRHGIAEWQKDPIDISSTPARKSALNRTYLGRKKPKEKLAR